MVDRYIHLHEDTPFTVEQFAAIYQPLESAVFNEVLPVEIVIPILFSAAAEDSSWSTLTPSRAAHSRIC